MILDQYNPAATTQARAALQYVPEPEQRSAPADPQEAAMPSMITQPPDIDMRVWVQSTPLIVDELCDSPDEIASHDTAGQPPHQQLSAHHPWQARSHRVSYTQKPLWRATLLLKG
jgi:hypothetical protein